MRHFKPDDKRAWLEKYIGPVTVTRGDDGSYISKIAKLMYQTPRSRSVVLGRAMTGDSSIHDLFSQVVYHRWNDTSHLIIGAGTDAMRTIIVDRESLTVKPYIPPRLNR